VNRSEERNFRPPLAPGNKTAALPRTRTGEPGDEDDHEQGKENIFHSITPQVKNAPLFRPPVQSLGPGCCGVRNGNGLSDRFRAGEIRFRKHAVPLLTVQRAIRALRRPLAAGAAYQSHNQHEHHPNHRPPPINGTDMLYAAALLYNWNQAIMHHLLFLHEKQNV